MSVETAPHPPALAPGGVYLMQDLSGTSHVDRDIEHPLGTLRDTVSCLHCMTVSLAQGSEGLGAMCGDEIDENVVNSQLPNLQLPMSRELAVT